ncbi:CvpA family protein [Lysobacter sp. CA199]|uniref:CvpA family protein n=1 Tax=Lysobacter sp. CA199 TaxID=3455608 RepID=UPI003F8D1631
MTALDWGLLLIVGLSALLGMARGLIGVAASLAAWLLAGLGAFLFGGDVGRSLTSELGWGSYAAGYALSFAVIWIGVGLIGYVIRSIAHSYGLSGMDRMMGMGLGAVRGVIFACAALVFMAMTTLPRERAWRESSFAAVLMPGARLMRSALPDPMAAKVDLEGRGNSLQATVQAEARGLEKNLKQKMPTGLPGGLGEAMSGGLGGLGGGHESDQRDQRDPSPLPLPLPEPESESSSGLVGLLPGAMRDLLPQSKQNSKHNRAEGTQIEGDPAQVGAQRRDDKQVQ